MKSYKLPKENCDILAKKAIASWDEALPLGNGKMGCLIWGASDALRLSLDRGDLWDNTPAPELSDERYRFKNLVQAARDGDMHTQLELFDAPYRHAAPTKLPAGKLVLQFAPGLPVSSRLHLADAHACVKIGQSPIVLESFLSAVAPVGLIRLSCPAGSFSVRLENPQFGVKTCENQENEEGEESVSAGSLKFLCYAPPVFGQHKTLRWFEQQVDEQLTYGIWLDMREQDGKTLIAYTVAASLDGENWREQALDTLRRSLDAGYDACYLEHRGWWEQYWSESAVTLPDELFEVNWYRTNYLLGACSRKGCPPMPLQGVWTADNGELPPWKGDYHNDLNTQLCYASYLKANHLAAGESFLDFLWGLLDEGKAFAREFYGTPGICMPSIMTIQGKPMGGWCMYSYSPTNQLWLCQLFERHYTLTGDETFLRERAYPYLKLTGECLEGLLEKNEEGQLVLPVSSSPEIHDNTSNAWVTPNSTYDLSLLRYLFTQLVRFARQLGTGEENRWQEILNALPQLPVNERNVLMLSPDESLTESHRHHSHMMAVYPLRQLHYEDEADRAVIDASVENLEVLGTGNWVGFSFPWMSAFYCMQHNGEGAAYQLKLFWENFCSPNGFHLNGDYQRRGLSKYHYRPFTLEANMAAADALQEMLLGTQRDLLEFFPAIPKQWHEGEVSFEQFRGPNGVLVSASMCGGAVNSITLSACHDGCYRLRSPFPEGFSCSLEYAVCREKDILCVTLKAGQTITISRK